MERKPLVFSYLRFSTPEQARGDSKRRQLNSSEKWAEQRGLTIQDAFSDLGVSAYKGRNASHGALALILRQIENGTIPAGSILLVESLDRLSRNEIPVALQLFLSILNAGVTIITLADNHEYTKTANLTDLITSIAIMSRANEESSIKGVRMAGAWEEFRKQAQRKEVVRNWVPAWLIVKGDKIVTNPAAVKSIRKVFDLASNGYGLGSITRKLNRDNVAAVGRSGKWTKTYVHLILRGRQVLGDLILRKTVDGKAIPVMTVPGYYPQVIDPQTWERANAILDSKQSTGFKGSGPAAKWVNLFSGLLFDEKKQTWVIHQNAAGGKKLVSNSSEQLGNGKRVFVSLDVFEAAFLDVMLKYYSGSFAKEERELGEADEWRGKIAEVDAKLATIRAESVRSGSSVAGMVLIVSDLEELRAKFVAKYKRTATQKVMTDKHRVMKIVETYRKLCHGELDYGGRAELQATVRMLVKRITLRAERDDEESTIGGSCFVQPFVGDEICFSFSYRFRRNTNSGSLLQRSQWAIIDGPEVPPLLRA